MVLDEYSSNLCDADFASAIPIIAWKWVAASQSTLYFNDLNLPYSVPIGSPYQWTRIGTSADKFEG